MQRAHETQLTGRCLGYRAVQVLAFVNSQIVSVGAAPSYSMICDELGISSRAKVNKIVKSLERRGLLRRVGAGRVRGVRSVNFRMVALGNTEPLRFEA